MMASKKKNSLSLLLLLYLVLPCCIATDTISSNQSIVDGMISVSISGVFALGFFSPGKSTKRYVGIWNHNFLQQKVVWVANRENPIEDTTGVLTLKDGNLAIFHGNEEVPIWSTNLFPAKHSFAKLLDSGNLVLSQEDQFQTQKVIWESFDYPTHAWLPGMKYGVDKRAGLNRSLVSWKSPDDPAPGDFVMRIDLRGLPQFYIFQGTKPYWRSGPWSGQGFAGVPEIPQSPYFNFTFVDNQDEIYVVYTPYNTSVLHHFVLDEAGLFQRLTWLERNHKWDMFWSAPRDRCDVYEECGLYGICDSNDKLSCICLPWFEPKSPEEWTLREGSEGCLRKRRIECGEKEGFSKLQHVKIPDTSIAQVRVGLGLKECEKECLRNCSCTAYTVADINKLGTGCVAWYGDLLDIRQYLDGGDDLCIRVDAIELANASKNSRGFGGSKKIEFIVLAPVTLAMLLGIVFCCSTRMKRAKAKGLVNEEKLLVLNDFLSQNHLQEASEHIELPFFDLDTVMAATDNFSDTNKLGQGGFGPVYKGRLSSGQDIAVKRLSKNSGQGIEELKNEVLLMTKLQHRNLVRLLGCCIQGEENMLIYEYMPNKSLDFLIFDQTRRALLDWKRRYHIIVGIARGILYLHQDSRFRIIHRDLKASNVLLDAEMNPKISDFGVARIFGGNQTRGRTKNVVGTYGYMSPEYAIKGLFSIKSDVFSFGVLVLEIICGKKNSGYYYDDPTSNVIGHAWDSWREGKAVELVDPLMKNSFPVDEILRCIQVALLCVQGRAKDRPSMTTVVFMLGTDTALPPPKPPAYVMINDPPSSTVTNIVTITMFEAR